MRTGYNKDGADASEENGLEFLLDRPIAFHRCFVTVTGSVNAAILLSQAIYWSRRTEDPKGWFWKTQEEWEEETGLKRFEQEGARKLLNKTHFWQEKLTGIPARLHFRISRKRLMEALALLGPPSMRKTSILVCGKPANKYAGNQHTSTETTTESTTNCPEPARSAHGAAGQSVLFPSLVGKFNSFIQEVTSKLETYVRVSRKINPHFNRKRWYQEMELLLNTLQGDQERLEHVLEDFMELPHNEYTPQVESAESFRRKFLQVESWVHRTIEQRAKENGGPEAVMEEYVDEAGAQWSRSRPRYHTRIAAYAELE